MKRAFLLLVASIYTMTCVGVTFQFHVCQKKVVALAIQQSLHDNDRCCNKPSKDNNCCKDITKVVKLDHDGLKYLVIKLAQSNSIDLPLILFPVYHFAFQLHEPTVVPDYPPPPLLSSVPRHLALGVILV